MADRIDALWSYIPFFAPLTFLYEPMKECLGAACYFSLFRNSFVHLLGFGRFLWKTRGARVAQSPCCEEVQRAMA